VFRSRISFPVLNGQNIWVATVLCHARYIIIIVSGVRLSPLGTAATTGLLYQPQMIDDGDYGEICGMKIGRENRSTRRKPAPAPHCPPQIPHDQTRVRTRAAAVRSQRLTAWAMARPKRDTQSLRLKVCVKLKNGILPGGNISVWKTERMKNATFTSELTRKAYFPIT
jgi:hypothetical protein